MKPTYRLSTFAQLATTQLYKILQLRSEVFILEQNCAYQDLDGLDLACYHLEQLLDDQLIGYTRLLAPGQDFDTASAIGRVVTSPVFRRQGYGRPLMLESIQHCKSIWPNLPIKIHAQTYLLDFYGSLGFKAYGEEFLEDGLPHRYMELPHV